MTGSKTKGIPVARVLVGAGLVGVLTGAVISTVQQRKIDAELERVYDEGQTLVPSTIPPATTVEDYMRPDPESLRGIPPYPGANPRRMGSMPAYQGQEFASAWFSTRDSVEDVVSFYEKAFEDLPTPVVSHRFSPNGGYVAFYEMPNLDAGLPDGGSVDVMSGKVHLVTAVHSGSQTLVFVSNSQPMAYLNNAATLRGGVQLPENALRPQVISVGEGPVKKKTVFSVVPATTLEDVRVHFEQSYAVSGWKVGDWVFNDDGSISTTATRKDENSTLLLKSEGPDVRLLLSLDSLSTFADHPPQDLPEIPEAP
jgi:hypothetical protein